MVKRIAPLTFVTLITGLMWSTHALALKYGPYTGVEGYQEIEVADDLYFVAFHGTRSNAIDEIDAAWHVRVAELCMERKASHFIQLKFSFEPVLKTDMPVLRPLEKEAMGSFIRVAGPVYIPIITPHRSGPVSEDAPSKQAHIRCVRDPALARSEARLQAVDAAIEDGKKRGWLATSAKK